MLGGIGPLVIVYKVTQFVHIVDVHTMRTYEIDSATYWTHMFKAVAGRERFTEFLVLSTEELDAQSFNISRATIKNKMKMMQVEVCRKSEFGCEDQ
jgi:NMD protein affecting ribosome stability and mRNA decay